MKVLSVSFRSIKAATTSPLRGSAPCSKITMSPSQMNFPIMESPTTRRANVFRVGLKPMDAISTLTHPSGSCSRSSANPAGMEPYKGISAISAWRTDGKVSTSCKARALPCSAIKTPFLTRAFRWHAAAFDPEKPKWAESSRWVGQGRPALRSESMNLRTASWIRVNFVISGHLTTIRDICQQTVVHIIHFGCFQHCVDRLQRVSFQTIVDENQSLAGLFTFAIFYQGGASLPCGLVHLFDLRVRFECFYSIFIFPSRFE